MKEKRGFTLIELLAVIVILAIIALISTPIILKIIETSKIKSLEGSCYGVIDAAKITYTESLLEKKGTGIQNGSVTSLKVANEKPVAGIWYIDEQSKNIIIKGVRFTSMQDYVCTNQTENYKVKCSKKSGEESLTIDQKESMLFPEQKMHFTYTVTGIDEMLPIWRSSDENVAEITSSGLVTAKKEGTTEISIEVGDLHASIPLHVAGKDSLVGYVGSSKLVNDTIENITVNNENYKAHIYSFEGDQVWDSDQTFGVESDVATASTEAENMIIVKVNGSLTVKEGVTVTTHSNNYGGPKGFMLFVSGTLTNNGTISMSKKGAKASGQNVNLWKNTDGSYEYIPAVGATGGDSQRIKYLSGSNIKPQNGLPGENGSVVSKRALGGGGAGGIAVQFAQTDTVGSKGGNATSYTGGGGGGGTARHSNSSAPTAVSGDGSIGGRGKLIDGSYDTYRSSAGGGAGSPSGIGMKSSKAEAGVEAGTGEVGTGGLLIIYARELQITTTGKYLAEGAKGGYAKGATEVSSDRYGSAAAGGGGSGGGSVNIFASTINAQEKTDLNTIFSVNGGDGGSASSATKKATGGSGGAGTFNIGLITSGTYQDFSL